jgi:DNA mismatch endonuclease (patch repair protein)
MKNSAQNARVALEDSAMTDVFTKRKRSEIMSSVRSKGNQTTEWRVRSRLVSAGVSGWKHNATEIFGKPDFAFEEERVAVFIDGCFWHGCELCRTIPAARHDFWLEKILRNKRRDRLVNRRLKKLGWHVIRFWEHEVRKEPEKCIARIKQAIGFKPS